MPASPNAAIPSAMKLAMNLKLPAGLGHEPSVRALMGKISEAGSSYLVTGGTDRKINFWDFTSASRCYNVSGIEGKGDKMSVLASSKSLFIGVPHQVQQGSQAKRITKPANCHMDSVLDLKGIDAPKAMLSCGGDGCIKVWR